MIPNDHTDKHLSQGNIQNERSAICCASVSVQPCMHKRIGENTRVNQKHTSNRAMKADLKHIVTDAAVILISDKLFNTLDEVIERHLIHR